MYSCTSSMIMPEGKIMLNMYPRTSAGDQLVSAAFSDMVGSRPTECSRAGDLYARGTISAVNACALMKCGAGHVAWCFTTETERDSLFGKMMGNKL